MTSQQGAGFFPGGLDDLNPDVREEYSGEVQQSLAAAVREHGYDVFGGAVGFELYGHRLAQTLVDYNWLRTILQMWAVENDYYYWCHGQGVSNEVLWNIMQEIWFIFQNGSPPKREMTTDSN